MLLEGHSPFATYNSAAAGACSCRCALSSRQTRRRRRKRGDSANAATKAKAGRQRYRTELKEARSEQMKMARQLQAAQRGLAEQAEEIVALLAQAARGLA